MSESRTDTHTEHVQLQFKNFGNFRFGRTHTPKNKRDFYVSVDTTPSAQTNRNENKLWKVSSKPHIQLMQSKANQRKCLLVLRISNNKWKKIQVNVSLALSLSFNCCHYRIRWVKPRKTKRSQGCHKLRFQQEI